MALPKKGQKSITVSGDTLKQLEKRYELEKKKSPKISFASFVSESALRELERKNLLMEAQFISLIGIQDNTVFLKDYRKPEKFIEVYLKDKKLTCICRQRNECVHIGFVLALPEVRSKLSH